MAEMSTITSGGVKYDLCDKKARADIAEFKEKTSCVKAFIMTGYEYHSSTWEGNKKNPKTDFFKLEPGTYMLSFEVLEKANWEYDIAVKVLDKTEDIALAIVKKADTFETFTISEPTEVCVLNEYKSESENSSYGSLVEERPQTNLIKLMKLDGVY